MQTIRVYAKESGEIAEKRMDFKLYKGSYQNVLLNYIIPKSMLLDEFLSDYPKVSNSVTISSKGLLQSGDEWNSRPFYLNPVKNFTQDGIEFALYERLLPRAFVVNAGDTEVSVTVQNITTTRVPVLDGEGQPTGEFEDKVEINQIISMQKFILPVLDSAVALEEVLEPYDSILIHAELDGIQEDLRSIYGAKSKSGTIVRAPNPINLSTLDDRTTSNTERLNQDEQRLGSVELQASANAQGIADINTKMRSGTRFLGTYPASTKKPSQTDLTTFAKARQSDAPLNGDEIMFTLVNDSGHPLQSFLYDYGFDATGAAAWDENEIPPIANAKNNGSGLIVGTYGIGATFNVIVDIVDGAVRRMFVKRTNGTYQELNVIIEDHETRITESESEIEGIRDGTIAVGNALRLGGKNESALSVAKAVNADHSTEANHALESDKASKDGIDRIIHATYALLTDTYTKQEADQIFASKIVGEEMFFGQNKLENEIPTEPADGVQATITLNASNPDEMMFFEKDFVAGLRVNNKNKFTARLFLTSNTTIAENITFEIYGKHRNETDYKLLASATKINTVLNAYAIEVVEFDGLFNGLTNGEIVTYIAGDTLRVEVLHENDPDNLSSPVTVDLITNQQYGSYVNITEPASNIIIRQESRKSIPITSTAWGTPDANGVYTLGVPFSEHQTSGGIELGAWFTEYGTGKMIGIDIAKDAQGNLTMESTFPYAGVLCIVGGVTGNAGIDYTIAENKPQIGGITLVGNKPAYAFDLYTRGEVRQVVADATKNLAKIRGFFKATLPTDVSFLTAGQLVFIWAGTGAPSASFPYTGVKQWDGTQFIDYQPEDGDVGAYTPAIFDIWINLNTPSGKPNCWAWMATEWDLQDFNVDMSAYRTKAEQDAIDATKASAADLQAEIVRAQAREDALQARVAALENLVNSLHPKSSD